MMGCRDTAEKARAGGSDIGPRPSTGSEAPHGTGDVAERLLLPAFPRINRKYGQAGIDVDFFLLSQNPSWSPKPKNH